MTNTFLPASDIRVWIVGGGILFVISILVWLMDPARRTRGGETQTSPQEITVERDWASEEYGTKGDDVLLAWWVVALILSVFLVGSIPFILS